MGVPSIRVSRNDLLHEMLRANGMYLVTVHNGRVVKCQAVDKDNLPAGEVREEGPDLPGVPTVATAPDQPDQTDNTESPAPEPDTAAKKPTTSRRKRGSAKS